MHDLSLGIQRTFFYIMYIYKVSLLFRVILSYVLALAAGKKKPRQVSGVRSLKQEWKVCQEKKEYARSEDKSSLHLPRMKEIRTIRCTQ